MTKLSQKDTALRYALIFFLACSRGAKPTSFQFKAMADLCGIALPIKHRLTREEWETIGPESHWDNT